MKYVVLRCEDVARTGQRVAALLEGAKTAHLLQLAQGGSAGRIHRPEDRTVLDRFQLHRGLFGLGLRDPEAAAGRCYAASANVNVADDETAWCCDFVTHRDGRIIDPTAGRIPTKESEMLIQALKGHLGAEGRRWEVGHGSHHLLVVRKTALTGDGTSVLRPPERLEGELWRQHLPKGAPGEALRSMIQEASTILEHHPVNRVRVDLGENPANMLWLWGASHREAGQTFRDRTGLSGFVVSNSFPMRGFAHALDLGWKEGPASLGETALQRLLKTLGDLLEHQDLVYLHLQVDAADPVERLCAMERIDHILLKALTQRLPALGPWRLLVVIDDKASGSVPFVAIGTGLARQPVANLTTERFAESPLVFADGSALFGWLTKSTG